ncbi:MAG: alpha-glucan family phosphorylase [Phycisphaerales bacterium]|nr:alpha-glucan family phosphorylase [Phycisphaerales bacterium]
MTDFNNYEIPYIITDAYRTKVAYFSMEFGIDQPLKTYSGGLGYLAGSHLKSAYEEHQNLIGIGILWKYGYYDQARAQDQSLNPFWIEKSYSFLVDTNIKFQIPIHEHPVWVKAFYLPPNIFKTAPLFLLSTDLPENDYVSQTISHRLYDANTATKIAQFILLGIGGATLIDKLNFNPSVYHLNEAHGVSCVFYMLDKWKSVDKVKEKLVFTTHTPEEAGNEKHDIYLCHKMSYFYKLSIDEVRRLTGITDNLFNHSLVALRFARKANGVSQLHGTVSRKMWSHYSGICPIDSITNAQNYNFWADQKLYEYAEKRNFDFFDERKHYLKKRTFEIIADQTGKMFDPKVLTIVWARRFAGYKRADLLIQDLTAFERVFNNTQYPIQMIWAGKPYPQDYPAISQFNELVHFSKSYKNVAVLIGYEIFLSHRLKQAADVWLNTPRVPREASGTSGMTAAMNGAVNFSTNDGWIPEFIKDGVNGFLIPPIDYEALHVHEQDEYDLMKLYEVLESKIIPTYYHHPAQWKTIIQNSMRDVRTKFDSNRMVIEYYKKMYNT